MKWQFHITVAAIVERAQKFLFVEEIVEGSTVINQPAGHWEKNETLAEAASRETYEETGWEFSPTALVGIYQWNHPKRDETFLRFTFCGDIGDRQLSTQLDEGILKVSWYTLDEILALPENRIRSTLVTESLRDYLAGKRQDLGLIRTIHQHW